MSERIVPLRPAKEPCEIPLGDGQVIKLGPPLTIEDNQLDLVGCVSGFQADHPDPPLCAACGLPVGGVDEDGAREIPMWFWRDNGRLSIAFHFHCGAKRLHLDTGGFAA